MEKVLLEAVMAAIGSAFGKKAADLSIDQVKNSYTNMR